MDAVMDAVAGAGADADAVMDAVADAGADADAGAGAGAYAGADAYVCVPVQVLGGRTIHPG